MESLVSELQRKSLDPEASVSELLRMAKVVAVKLDLAEFRAWVDAELGGYEGREIPAYRTMRGEMKAVNPFYGLVPAVFGDEETAQVCRTTLIGQRISEIEALAQSNNPIQLQMTDKVQLMLQNLFSEDLEFKLILPNNAFIGIVESVRNAILDWSLSLEQSGIKGEGMTFSKQDKEIAHSPGVTYKIDRIENFTGNLGNVNDHAVVNASASVGIDSAGLSNLFEQLRKYSHDLGLEQSKQSALMEKLLEVEELSKASKPSPSKIGAALGFIRSIVQSGTSSLLVHGALAELDKYKHLIGL